MTSSRQGLFIQNEYFDHEKSNSDGTLFSIVPRGFITYRHMSDDDIFHFNINILCDYGLVSKEYPVFTTDSELDTNLLVEHLNSSKDFLSFCKRQKKGGTRTRLYFNVLGDYQIAIPERDEQKKVAQFLDLINARIAFQQRFIDALKSYKRGVSNAVFTHSVRFRHEGEAETSAWRVMPFSEVFDFLNSNTLSRADLNYSSGEVKNIHYGDILTKYGAIIDPCSSTVPYINTDAPLSHHKLDYLKTGDIVIADTAEDLTAGKVTEIACSNEAKCVSGLHTVACRPRQRFASGYLGHYLNSAYYHRQLLPLIQGTKVSSIARSALAGTQIAFPCLSDQIKVSKCLSLIDTRVEIEERKLERLVECKKSLLQKLFI